MLAKTILFAAFFVPVPTGFDVGQMLEDGGYAICMDVDGDGDAEIVGSISISDNGEDYRSDMNNGFPPYWQNGNYNPLSGLYESWSGLECWKFLEILPRPSEGRRWTFQRWTRASTEDPWSADPQEGSTSPPYPSPP